MGCYQEHSALETCPECEFEPFVRNHFFTGKMMGAGEFVTETLYHSDKMRHHNARLHGAGVVCGLKVRQHPSPECRMRYVIVEPGSALDCCGHEILVAQEEILDVARHVEVVKTTGDGRLHTLQVCVRYRECPTEEVPVLYDECGCDDTKCAPNRILESFELDVLVDPPLSGAELVGTAPLGGFVATDTHGITGFSRASAAGLVVAADPGHGNPGIDPMQPTRIFVLDPKHRAMRTIMLASAARALALSADGNFVFAAVAPDAGAPAAAKCRVRIFKVEDGTEVVPATPAKLEVPGTTAASILYGAAGTGDGGFVVYDKQSGNAYRWAVDATPINGKGLVEAVPPPIVLEAGLSGVVANADASALFGIAAADAAGNSKVKRFALPGGAATIYNATGKPTALAAYAFGTAPKPMLAIASRDDKRVYLVDLGAPATITPVDVDRTPAHIGVVGSGDDMWLHVLEEDTGHLYVQAFGLAPMAAAAGQPLASAPRLAANGVRAIVLAFPDGRAAMIDATRLADSDCADHLWKQLEGCPDCEMPDCIVLATIPNYRTGMQMLDAPGLADDLAQGRTRIDNRAGRRMLASTATLQAWLQCLQLKGGIPGPAGANGTNGTNGTNGQNGTNGTNGDDGIGLDVGLPKIIDIGWLHGGVIKLDDLRDNFSGIPDFATARTRIQHAKEIPLFTLYFNRKVSVSHPSWWRRVLTLRVEAPLALALGAPPPHSNSKTYLSPGFYWPLDIQLLGDILEVDPAANTPMITPHTNEQAQRAVTFLLRKEFFHLPPSSVGLGYLYLALTGLFARVANLQNPAPGPEYNLEQPVIRLKLDGNFVGVTDNLKRILQDKVLDGDNIGGRVGVNEQRAGPITGGKNPSGNLAQGGAFESWITVETPNYFHTDDLTTGAGMAMTQPMTAAMAGVTPPRSANLVSVEELGALPGVSAALSRRVMKERESGPFRGIADLRKRVKTTDAELKALTDHLIAI